MDVQIKWLGHASFRISSGDSVLYIDPWKLKNPAKDADIVLVSHSHYDHYSAEDIKKVSKAGVKIIASTDVIASYGYGQAITPGQTIDVGTSNIMGVPAYNPDKQFHPKEKKWLGYVIEIAGKRIYYAGDTDLIDEMQALKDIDLALLPVGGTFTLDAFEAVRAIDLIKPKAAIPYHWGDIVGSRADAEQFAKKAGSNCQVTILSPGEEMVVE